MALVEHVSAPAEGEAERFRAGANARVVGRHELAEPAGMRVDEGRRVHDEAVDHTPKAIFGAVLFDLFGPYAAVRLRSAAALVQALIRVVAGDDGWHFDAVHRCGMSLLLPRALLHAATASRKRSSQRQRAAGRCVLGSVRLLRLSKVLLKLIEHS